MSLLGDFRSMLSVLLSLVDSQMPRLQSTHLHPPRPHQVPEPVQVLMPLSRLRLKETASFVRNSAKARATPWST